MNALSRHRLELLNQQDFKFGAFAIIKCFSIGNLLPLVTLAL